MPRIVKPLTDTVIRNAKPSTSRRKLSDGGGLQLWVMPTGSKLWHLAYRLHGKQRLLAMGAYPARSLADARAMRDDAKALVAKGVDPAQQKKADKLAASAAQANTFEMIAGELVEKKRREGKAGATLGKNEWLLGIASQKIGRRPITEISVSELLDVLRSLEARGHLETARRLRAVISQVYRYAIATGRAEGDPTYGLRGALAAPKAKHRAAITDPKEFGALLRAIEGFAGQPTTKAALKLMAYLFPRPGELRQAEWSEFDLNRAVWTIPESRMKMRREHRVPLPTQAVEILLGLRGLTGYGSLVFPGYGRSGGPNRKLAPRPLSENTLNGALRRLGFGPDEMTSHGFRATASTLLNESGQFSVDAVERALAHQEADAVRRAYARGEHWKERVAMAQWWADQVDALREGGKVIVAEFGGAT